MSEWVCVCARTCVFFLKDLGTQFSDFFLNVSYVCFASQRGAESLKPHPMYTHTYTPCIKSVSVKSRRVLGLPPLDLQNQGKGGGGRGGRGEIISKGKSLMHFRHKMIKLGKDCDHGRKAINYFRTAERKNKKFNRKKVPEWEVKFKDNILLWTEKCVQKSPPYLM